MRCISKAAFAAVTSFCLIGAAAAADLPAKAPSAVAPVPAWNWSGLYAGVNAGGGFGDPALTTNSSSPLALENFFATTTHPSMLGFIGGGQIGFNWQFAPMWLAGVEADFQGADQKGTTTTAFTFPGEPASDTASVKLKWLGTVRGRLGLLTNADETLWYVTGGLAYGGVDMALSSSNFIFPANAVGTTTFSHTKTGWTLGGGVEEHLFGNWTAKVEYLYVDLGSVQDTAQAFLVAGVPPATAITAHADLRDHIVRAGLNYKFWDWPAGRPTVAAMAAAPWNWSGSYAGFNVGGSVADTALAESSTSPLGNFSFISSTTHASATGIVGGGQIGTNWQFAPAWLAGIEADFQGTDQKSTSTFAWTFPGQTSSDTVSVKTKWLGTVRGRFGFLTNNGANLWYATGGVAYGRTDLSLASNNFVFATAPAAATFTHDKVGWTVGGGLESHLVGNWTGKLEYLYVDLGSVTDTAQGFNGPGLIATSITAHADLRDHIVRAGVNYKFW
ncbi:MAG TPA: outer membrane beta-barrel protein [Pseudolabrys sp.]|nr:outer membrane beta-barrel protein [Pseudolabrys sp.]